MQEEISSFSFTLSSGEETNDIISNCQIMMEDIVSQFSTSAIESKLSNLADMFEKLK